MYHHITFDGASDGLRISQTFVETLSYETHQNKSETLQLYMTDGRRQ
jgi:hypothetical protein